MVVLVKYFFLYGVSSGQLRNLEKKSSIICLLWYQRTFSLWPSRSCIDIVRFITTSSDISVLCPAFKNCRTINTVFYWLIYSEISTKIIDAEVAMQLLHSKARMFSGEIGFIAIRYLNFKCHINSKYVPGVLSRA